MTENLSDALQAARPRYELYMPQLKTLLETLLSKSGIVIQSVTARVKTQDSALAKAGRSSGAISSTDDLHDLLGLRVITYFADQVDSVAELFRNEFDVDESRTKDRRNSIDADRFGYLSMHLAIRLNETRRELTEWGAFGDIWAEVQIRSSLQHSWAEIEHDLGYKSASGSIPDSLRRRFSRLAGLLEIADDEFIALREELESYEETVALQLESGEDAPIDQASLFAFMRSSSVLKQLDDGINSASRNSALLPLDERYAGWRSNELRKYFSSIKDVERRLASRSEIIKRTAIEWIRSPRSEAGELYSDQELSAELPRGIGLFYLTLDTLAFEGSDALSSILRLPGAERFLEIRAQVEADVESD